MPNGNIMKFEIMRNVNAHRQCSVSNLYSYMHVYKVFLDIYLPTIKIGQKVYKIATKD